MMVADNTDVQNPKMEDTGPNFPVSTCDNEAIAVCGNYFGGSCSAGKGNNLYCGGCPLGKYREASQLELPIECSDCSAGKWSNTSGIRTEDQCKPCSAGKWSNETGQAQDQCKPCSAGKWSNIGMEFCIGCDPGEYANKTGSTSCKKCGKGQYNKEKAQANCSLCPKGRYSNIIGLSDQCEPCAIGKWSDKIGMMSVSSCKRCAAGLYNNGIGMEFCKGCDPGRYANKTGSTLCKECGIGQYNEEKAQANCSLCPKGRYSSKEGVTLLEGCRICPSGQFSNTTGATYSCYQCPIGRALLQEGCPDPTQHDSLEDCVVCSRSTYQSERGQDRCLDCAQGKTIPAFLEAAENHDSIEDCTVLPSIPVPSDVVFSVTKEKDGRNNGTGISYTSLITWSINHTSLQEISSSGLSFRIELSKTADFDNVEHRLEGISSKSRSYEFTSLLNDPLWKVALFGRVRVSTKGGEEGDWSDKSLPWITSDECVSSWLNNTSSNPLDWSCSRCPGGAFCDGGPWFSVKAKFGHYRVPSANIPARFDRCLYPGACLGAPNNEYSPGEYLTRNGSMSYVLTDFLESCNEEYGFQQPSRLCHACRFGFRRHGRFRCALCPGDGQNFLLLGLGVLVVTVAVIFFIKMTVADAGRTKISESIQKIVINYAQVITIFAHFPLRWPPIIEGMFGFQGSISTVGEHLLNPDCVSSYGTAAELYYSKQIAYTLLPVLLIMLCYVVWRCVACYNKVDFGARLNLMDTTPKDKSIISICVLLYLMYPTICNQALGLFSCMEVEIGHVFLLADLEEECYVGKHLFMAMMFGLLQVIVYVIGLPLLGVYFMWRNHERLDSHVVRTRYGLFLGGYRNSRYYWEILLVARKVAIIMVSVFGTVIKVETQAHVVLLLVFLAMLAESVGHPFDSRAGFNDRYGTPRIRYRTLHRLELSSLFVIWITLWCGLLIYQINDISSSVHAFISIFVIMINTMLMCWMAWKFVVEKVYEFKHDKQKKKGEAETYLKYLTKCTEKCIKACPCLKEEKLMGIVRTSMKSMKSFHLGRINSFKNFKMRRAMPLPPKSGRGRGRGRSGRIPSNIHKQKLESSNPYFGKGDDGGGLEMTPAVAANGIGNEAVGAPWIKVKDDETGDDYVYNEETGESKWIEDEGEEIGDAPWIKVKDHETGDDYWFNEETQESKWVEEEAGGGGVLLGED
jgi:hypothetical protein